MHKCCSTDVIGNYKQFTYYKFTMTVVLGFMALGLFNFSSILLADQ